MTRNQKIGAVIALIALMWILKDPVGAGHEADSLLTWLGNTADSIVTFVRNI